MGTAVRVGVNLATVILAMGTTVVATVIAVVTEMVTVIAVVTVINRPGRNQLIKKFYHREMMNNE
jgi:hypothetical protein